MGVMQPENPLVGGTVLRRAAIQSPNFVTGSAGWTIKQDGSAEFNNVVIRNGQIVSGTALYYSSLPVALGKLVASVSAAPGFDSAGNAYLAGEASYAPSNLSANYATAISGNSVQFFTGPVNSNGAGPWTLAASFALDADPATQLVLTGPSNGLNVPVLSTALVTTGGLQATGGAADKVVLTNALAGGKVLQVTDTTAAPTAPIVQLIAAAATPDFTFGIQVSGDANQRFRVDSDGSVHWGTGALATDTSLSRSAAGQLTVGTTLKTSGLIASGSALDQVILSNGLAGGDVLKVTNTTAAPTGATAHLVAAAAADRLLALQVTGDTVTRLLVDSNGKHSWGPGGAAAQDVTMQRNAGHLDVTATDGNVYSAERLTVVNNGQTITSVSPSFTAVTGISAAVANGTTYRWRLWVSYQGSAAAGAPVFEVTGPATSTSNNQLSFTTNGTATVTQRGAGLNTAQTGPTFQTAAQLLVFEGVFTPSANGTLALEAATNTSGDNLVINAAALDLFPVI